MPIDSVFRLPLAVLMAVLVGIMLATLEVGRWFGGRAKESYDVDSRSYASGLHTAILGLLALLLGFAFSLAASHFVLNRDLVAEEANAIDTAFRRADIAADPQRGTLKELLRRYLETRIAYYSVGIDEPKRRAVDEESLALQGQMWRQAAEAADRTPTCTTALLVHAVNRVIEMHETRADAARNHIPMLVLWLLVSMSAAVTGLTGYVASFGNGRHRSPTAIMVVLIALVLVVIVDLDRPMRGLIHGGQPSLFKLRRIMAVPTAAER